MIETDQQRRWWFATHPEFSRGRRGARTGGGKWQSSFVSPPIDQALNDKYGHQIYEIAHELELWRQAIEQDKKGLEADPHTFLDLVPYRRLITSPIGALKDLFRGTVKDAILNAVKRGKSKGPGDWVEVGRSPTGLEHQSRMSGQPIRERGGKLYIREYELNGVKFDDYKDGKLYEYKGPHGRLLNKDREFDPWFRGTEKNRKEARDQLKAAKGIPVIWRVGADQVKAFEKALHGIKGIKIEP